VNITLSKLRNQFSAPPSRTPCEGDVVQALIRGNIARCADLFIDVQAVCGAVFC